MKVFEVISEYDDEDGKTVKRIQYVSHFNNDIAAVTRAYADELEHTEIDLIGVREILTVSRQL